MNKRQKKKRDKDKLPEDLMRAYGMAVGKAREEYFCGLMNENTEKAEKSPGGDQK